MVRRADPICPVQQPHRRDNACNPIPMKPPERRDGGGSLWPVVIRIVVAAIACGLMVSAITHLMPSAAHSYQKGCPGTAVPQPNQKAA